MKKIVALVLFLGLMLSAKAQQPLLMADYWNHLVKEYNNMGKGILDYNIETVHGSDASLLRAKISKIDLDINNGLQNCESLLLSNPENVEITKMVREILIGMRTDLNTKTWLGGILSTVAPTYREQYEELKNSAKRQERLDSMGLQFERIKNLFVRKYKAEISILQGSGAMDSLLRQSAGTIEYARKMEFIRIGVLIYLHDVLKYSGDFSCDSVKIALAALEQQLILAKGTLKKIGYYNGDNMLSKQTERCLAITDAALAKDLKVMYNFCKRFKDESLSATDIDQYNNIVKNKIPILMKQWKKLIEIEDAFLKKYMPKKD